MHKEKIEELTLDEKLDIIMFDRVISIHKIEEKGIPEFYTSDGPHRVCTHIT